jgi:hypothetical protein
MAIMMRDCSSYNTRSTTLASRLSIINTLTSYASSNNESIHIYLTTRFSFDSQRLTPPRSPTIPTPPIPIHILARNHSSNRSERILFQPYFDESNTKIRYVEQSRRSRFGLLECVVEIGHIILLGQLHDSCGHIQDPTSRESRGDYLGIDSNITFSMFRS